MSQCLHDDVFADNCSPGKIKDLLAKDVVDAETRLVLVNAIYFKGNWNQQFKEDFTVDAQFRINKVTLHKKQHSMEKYQGAKAAFWVYEITLHYSPQFTWGLQCCSWQVQGTLKADRYKAVLIWLNGNLQLESDTLSLNCIMFVVWPAGTHSVTQSGKKWNH